jgi:hypothetical protein
VTHLAFSGRKPDGFAYYQFKAALASQGFYSQLIKRQPIGVIKHERLGRLASLEWWQRAVRVNINSICLFINLIRVGEACLSLGDMSALDLDTSASVMVKRMNE